MARRLSVPLVVWLVLALLVQVGLPGAAVSAVEVVGSRSHEDVRSAFGGSAKAAKMDATPVAPADVTPVTAISPTSLTLAAPVDGAAPPTQRIYLPGLFGDSAPGAAAAPPGAASLNLSPDLSLNLDLGLDLSLTADPTWAEPGNVVTFSVTARNEGVAPLSRLALTDTLPDGLLYVAQSAVGFSYDPSAGQLTWAAGELAAGAVISGGFQVRVGGLALGATVTNTVSAAAAGLAETTASVALVIVSPRSNEVWVTPGEGGRLHSLDGRVELRIPPGAVQRRTRISYTPRPDLERLPPHILAPFALEAQDDGGQAVRQFTAPLTLRLAYTSVQSLPSVYTEPGLFTLDEASGQWLALPAEVDQAAGRLRAALTHFSIYSEGNTSYVLERMSSLRGAQTNLFTRSIGYSYGFELPPGRGGLVPQLGLSYASANHTPNSGHFSYAGFGWELTGADSISTAPGDANTFQPTLSLQGATYSLRQTADGTWFAKENPFLKIQAADVSHYTPATWHVWTPDGVKYTFSAASAGAYYWKLCNTGNVGKRYVRVPLVSIQDTYSNTVSFTWQTETETNVPYDCQIDPSPLPTNQFVRALRLTALSYNGGAVQATLNYTTRDDRPDGYDSTAWRFYTTQRLTDVTVQAKENGSGALRTVRSYALGQTSGPATALSQKVLNLDWLEERSAGGNALPRSEFGYTHNYFSYDDQFGALSLVRNGYGGEVAFASQNRNGAATAHIVNTRTERDGIDGTPDAEWSYTSSAWDATGDTLTPKLAQGYSQVTVTLASANLVERHDFIVLSTVSNGQKVDHLAGRETQRVISSGAVELAKTVTTWISTTQSLPLTGYSGMLAQEQPRFVYAGATETWQDGQRRVRTENQYQTARQGSSGQQFGNLTEQRAYAGTASGWEAQPTRTRYFWYYPNTSAWLINKLAVTQLYKVCDGCTGAALAGASLYYYDNATVETTAPILGRLTKQREGVGAEQFTTAQYDYWPNGNLKWSKDGKDNLTEMFYDSAFQAYPVCVKNAAGQKTVTRYYGVPGSSEAGCTTSGGSLPWSGGAPVAGKVFGQVEDTTDANLALTSLAYDVWGRVTQVWRPGDSQAAGHSATQVFAYTNYSNSSAPFKVQQRQRDDAQGGSGAATYLESYTFYDGLGQTIQTQAEAAVSTQLVLTHIGYDGVGQVVSQTLPYTVTAALGAYRTPDWGQPKTINAYDVLGRVTTVTNPDGTASENRYTVEYNPGDADFNTLRPSVYSIDANRRFVRRAADVFGNLRIVSESTGSWPAGQANPTWGSEYRTRYTYDVAGRLLTVQDHAGNQTTLTYDSLGRKTQMVDPDMGTWYYAYDAVSNLTRQTDAKSQRICFYYDGLNRLKGKTTSTGTAACPADSGVYTTTYGYDAYNGVTQFGLGRRTAMTDTSGSTSWNYDSRGRVITETKVISGAGGGTFVTGWGYDSADRARLQKYPGGNAGQVGEQITLTYTDQGLLRQVQSNGSTFYVGETAYNALGQVLERRLGSTAGVLKQLYTYTAAENFRLVSLKTNKVSPYNDLQNISYTYDDVGNVLTISDAAAYSGTLPATQTQTFTYDALHRLSTAQASGPTTYGGYSHLAPNDYVYDAIGNVTKFQGTALTYQDTAHKHAVTHVAGVQKYWYDQNGNATKRINASQTITMTYDVENRLIGMSGGVTANYVYDGDGVRVKETISGVTRVFIGNYYEVDNGVVKKYYYAGSTRVAENRGGTLYYLLGDHLGSTALTLDDSGNRLATNTELRYFPYGATRYDTNNQITTFNFTGQRKDSGSGLLFYNARWYDPVVGRFLQADTIVPGAGNPQALNRYSYTLNNPLKYSDPTGHFFIPIAAMAVTGVIGAGAGFLGSVVGQVAGNLITGASFEDSLNINWKDVGVATAVGATAGFFAPVTATTMAGAIVTNAVASGVQYLASQVVNERPVNGVDLGVSVGLGAVAGRIIGPLKSTNPLPPDITSPWLSRWAQEAKQIVNEDLRKAAVAGPAVVRSFVGGITSNAPASQMIEKIQQPYRSQGRTSAPVPPKLSRERQWREVRWQ